MESIEKRIINLFHEYDSTIDLLNFFKDNKQYAQEFILLVCSRLDSLANMAAYQQKKQHKRFVSFIQMFSDMGIDFYSISLPELFYYLHYQLYVVSLVVPKPGRLSMLDVSDYIAFIPFIWQSGIPITELEISRFIKFLLVSIQKQYRVTPTQKRSSKKSIDGLNNVMDYLTSSAQKYWHGHYKDSLGGLKEFLSEFSIGNIMYKEYRCSIIHRYKVDVSDNRFFREKDIYYETVYNNNFEVSKFLNIQFPAEFLLTLLTNCLKNYQKALIDSKKLPLDMFNLICDTVKEIKYLDDNSVPDIKNFNIKFQ
ncbi:MAG: hypothetical protein HPY74_17580 [Firmicutes bacterium]|nr:hypothetical protein [Bacillota bacterium]